MMRHILEDDAGITRPYEFALQISDAIEAYTAKMESTWPGAYMHDAVNLAHAVEREMYVKHVNSRRLALAYSQWADGKPHQVRLRTGEEGAIFDKLCGSPTTTPPWGGTVTAALRNAAVAAKRIAARPFSRRRTSSEKDRHHAVLVQINTTKGVRILSPVLEQLGTDFAYITYDRPQLATALKKAGLPVVSLSGCPPNGCGNPIGHGLKPYAWLADCLDCYTTHLAQNRPQCVLLLEGNSSLDEVLSQACRRLQIPTVCLQQGWSPYVHNGFRHLSYDKMLMWGDGFAEILKAHNPTQRFVPVGSHLLDVSSHPIKEATSSIQGAVTFFLQSVSIPYVSQAHACMLELATTVSERFPSRTVIIREHPEYPLTTNEATALLRHGNVRLMPSSTHRLSVVLEASLLSVAVYSTSILESIAADVVPLIMNVIGMPSYCPDVATAKAGREVRSVEEAMQFISTSLEKPGSLGKYRAGMSRLRQQFFGTIDKEASLARIVTEIKSCMDVCDEQ
jgi:hypothetical protein